MFSFPKTHLRGELSPHEESTAKTPNVYHPDDGTNGVDEVEVSTVVYVSPEEAFEVVVDFPRYVRYTEHLEEVKKRGDGGPGTVYDLRVTWWKLSYTARSRVTDVDAPRRLDWRVIKDVNAHGSWYVEPAPEEAPEGGEASRIRFRAAFDPDSASASALDLPPLISMGWVVDRVKPRVADVAERIVERMVLDLEGETRPVELTIHTRPSST